MQWFGDRSRNSALHHSRRSHIPNIPRLAAAAIAVRPPQNYRKNAAVSAIQLLHKYADVRRLKWGDRVFDKNQRMSGEQTARPQTAILFQKFDNPFTSKLRFY
ncbi:uncharacterized protein LOC125231999 [Leguminivora glycinivorella]|uniref:uncharacterized protein LOC125231999 n=1 Tax=Leguminivora glycinivorella TaxID=1035111 RepID=UPI00200D7202|nr:uncharacterized protein LOC125231999 [Leguminivora glycinivorella]